MTANFALLGAGRIGKAHARAIAAQQDARLVAVYDPVEEVAEAMKARYGCEIRNIEAIAAAEDIDAVVICTPTGTHAALIEQFARAGKAIFCEKPIDLSYARVQQCLAVVEETNARLMVGFNRRFDPHFAALKKAIDAGDIGSVEQIVITSRDPAPPCYDYIESSGGIFRDMTIHDFDMARYLLGEEVETLYATGSVLFDQEIARCGDYDSVCVVMETLTGKQVVITNSRRSSYGYDQRIEVHGSAGMLAAHNPLPVTTEIATAKGFLRQPLHEFFMSRYVDAYAAEIGSFIAALRSGAAEMTPSGKDGLVSLAMADAASKSARQKVVVRLDNP